VNVAFLVLLAVSIFITVLLRYIFRVAVPEMTVLQRFAVAWLVFLGAALLVWEEGHLKIDIFGPYLSARGKKVQRVLIDVLLLGALVVLVLAGRKAFVIGIARTELIELRFLEERISLAYFNSAFFVGSCLMLLFHILKLLERYVITRRHRAEGDRQ
jgi:TRAP-type C4-dicarboxylate transport system permease small subunit